MTGPVVVGLDGSPASAAAAWWAAREAVNRGLPLALLHSWTTQPLDLPTGQEADSKRRRGREILERTATELLDRHADLSLTAELVSATAVHALLAHGERASLIVLGSRGHGSVAGFLLGSISLHVLGLAACPAVAVRADEPGVEPGPGHSAAADRDEVVVGVHGPRPAADPLLEFAFTTATTRGAGLRAVRVLPLTSLVNGLDADVEAEEGARLAEALAPWREKFPDVPVTEHIAMGTAAHVLLTASARSCLTVLGRSRHPSHQTWKLGPVAHAALHHVACPVAVVPHD